jgi:hypothetical protein
MLNSDTFVSNISSQTRLNQEDNEGEMWKGVDEKPALQVVILVSSFFPVGLPQIDESLSQMQSCVSYVTDDYIYLFCTSRLVLDNSIVSEFNLPPRLWSRVSTPRGNCGVKN